MAKKRSWLIWICQSCHQEVGLDMRRVDIVRLHPNAELQCPECGGKTVILLTSAAPDAAGQRDLGKYLEEDVRYGCAARSRPQVITTAPDMTDTKLEAE